MIPNVTFKAHYSAPPQAKEFLTYLLTNHPTSNAVGIKVELVAIKWKKINGDCTGTPFMGGVYNSIRISVGTKDRPRSTPHILRTLAHEYKHVLQNDISIGNEPARCVEANAFANKVVPLFLFQLQSSSGKILAKYRDTISIP